MEQSSGTQKLCEGEGGRQGTAARAVLLNQSWTPALACAGTVDVTHEQPVLTWGSVCSSTGPL